MIGPRTRLLLLPLLLLSCQTTPPGPGPASGASDQKPRKLTVVGISDFHGAFTSRTLKSAGGATLEVGGAALMAAYLNQIRSQAKGPVLLLDAGDMYQGTLASGLAEGAPVIALYNHLGLAAAAVGNHEFDFGPVGPDSVPRSATQDPRGALRARIDEANFPFLSANVRDASGEVPEPFIASHLLNLDGLQVGLVGVSSASTASTTVARNLEGLHFVDPVPVAVAEGKSLREAGAELLLLIFHDGSGCTPALGTGMEGCEAGELVRMMEGLPEGLFDLVLGGHTHALVARQVGRTAVVQAGARGQLLSWAELEVGAPPIVHAPVPLCGSVVPGKSGSSCEKMVVRASEATPKPATFLGATMVPDPEVQALIEPFLEAARGLEARELGIEVLAPVTRAYGAESALGNLVADAFRASTPDVQVGLTNGGGLRADLPAGALRWGHIFQALPFDNHLAILELSGAQLRRIIDHGLGSGHGMLSWSGLTLRARGCELLEVKVGKKLLDDGAIYRVATNDYLAGGGSGFGSLGIAPSKIQVLWERPLLREIVADYLVQRGESVDPLDFFDPKAPRQIREVECETVRRSGS